MLSKNLIKKSGLYFIGNISTKFINFILLPIYAYFMSTSDFGSFDLINTIANLFAPIVFFSIWDGVLKFLLDDEQSELEVIISTTFIFSFIIFFIITALFTIYSIFFGINYFYISIYLLLLVFAFQSLWQYSARGLKENKAYVLASIISAIINFISSVIMLVVFKMGMASLIIALILGAISGIIIIERKGRILKSINIYKFDFRIFKKILKYSFPLVINAIAGWGILSVCRFIVAIKLGTEVNGIYAYATKFNQFIMTFGQIFNMAWLEESIISINSKNANIYFSNSIKNISRVMLGVLIIAGPIIAIYYDLISNTGYSKAENIFPILLIVPVIQTISTNIGCIFQAKNKTNVVFYTTILGAVFSVIISWVSIDKYGLLGVAFAQFLGMLAMLISRKIITNKLFRVDIEPAFLSMNIIYYIFSTYIAVEGNLLIKLIICIINIAIAVILNKTTLIQINKMVIAKIK